MTFVRTVAGDIDPADLGVTYAHEHLIIDGGRLHEIDPDFAIDSVEDAVAELAPAVALGLRTVVDAMPGDAGRNVRKLASVGAGAGIHVIAATGFHLARYHADDHWGLAASVDDLAAMMRREVTAGVDGTSHRAGIIKIASDRDALSPRDRRVFEAAALVHRETGVPILTHCTDGTAADAQLALFDRAGVDLGHVVLSHTDKIVDRGYHRAILETGASVEFDGGMRWKPDQPNGTLQLLEWLLHDGFGGQLMLGMDAARRSYWAVHGGRPGMAYLLDAFSAQMADRGIDATARRTMFVANPARVLAFAR